MFSVSSLRKLPQDVVADLREPQQLSFPLAKTKNPTPKKISKNH